jgi:hypothetical protein
MQSTNQSKMLALINQKPADKKVRDYCKENEISEAVYFYWRNKINKKHQSPAVSSFIPIQVTNSSGGALASIQLPGGAVINVFSPEVFSFIHALQ